MIQNLVLESRNQSVIEMRRGAIAFETHFNDLGLAVLAALRLLRVDPLTNYQISQYYLVAWSRVTR